MNQIVSMCLDMAWPGVCVVVGVARARVCMCGVTIPPHTKRATLNKNTIASDIAQHTHTTLRTGAHAFLSKLTFTLVVLGELVNP